VLELTDFYFGFTGILAFCGENRMTIFSEFSKPFKGRIYADGYVDEPDCGITAAGNPNENITFQIPYESCGIQMTSASEVYLAHTVEYHF